MMSTSPATKHEQQNPGADIPYERFLDCIHCGLCTASCPTEATVFGSREELLKEARKRIEAAPELYRNHVWGETEAGGTNVLTISDVDIPLPNTVPTDALPERTWAALKTVPYAFIGAGVGMLGLRWIMGRRNELREAEARAQAARAEEEAKAAAEEREE